MELPPGRACCLAAYLALRADWVPRDELVALLWPDASPQQGRHSLSQLLYAVRRTAWGHDIDASATRLRWRPGTDVASFALALSVGDWERAIVLYQGPLLQGACAAPSPTYQDWLFSERDQLHAGWRRALLERAGALEYRGRPEDAIPLLRRLLGADGLLEAAAQALIRCELRLGHRDAALRAFERFRQRLADELGLEPLPATLTLLETVRGEHGSRAAGPEAAGGASLE